MEAVVREQGWRDAAALGMVALGLATSLALVLATFALRWAYPSVAAEPPPPTPSVVAAQEVDEWVTLPDGTEVLNDGSVVISTKMMLQMAEDLCPSALDYGNCEDVEVRLVDFFDPQVGEAGLWITADGTDLIGADSISLDPDLVGYTVEMVEHVIVHEWNHAEQANLAGTKSRWETMASEADRYFSQRVVKAEEELDGAELLTDCMTYYQDEAKGYDHYEFVTSYAQIMLGATSMEQACGDGWQDLLPEPVAR